MRFAFLAPVVLAVAGTSVLQTAVHVAPQQPQPMMRAASMAQKTAATNGIPISRAADSYAIYSLLLPGAPFSSMPADQTTRWAIARKTIDFNEMNPKIEPEGALQPPPGDDKPFHEAVEDFKVRRFEQFTLQPKFKIDHAYVLLSAGQVGDLRAAKSSPDPGSRLQSAYAGVPGVTFFTEVYFDSKQQAALVFMNDWCAKLCSEGQWIYLEKHGGQWQKMSGITRPGA